jgi:hypothetical protein
MQEKFRKMHMFIFISICHRFDGLSTSQSFSILTKLHARISPNADLKLTIVLCSVVQVRPEPRHLHNLPHTNARPWRYRYRRTRTRLRTLFRRQLRRHLPWAQSTERGCCSSIYLESVICSRRSIGSSRRCYRG